MDFIKQWTFCVCITLITALLLSALSPDGNIKKFYKIVISVFIFISFLYPFSNFNNNKFELKDLTSVHYNSNSVDNEAYENMICSQIKRVLSDNDIKGSVVNASVVLCNNEIEIKSVQIAVSDEYDTKSVQDIVFNNLGINVRVIHNGE